MTWRRTHGSTRRRVTALAAAAAAALLGAMLVTGCASEQDRYCDAVRDSAPELERLSRQADRVPAASVLASIPILAELAERSPTELVDEWTTVMNALRTFEEVLRESGVETGPGAAEAIEALPAQERTAVQRAAGRLAEPQVIEASRGIEDYGTQVCDESLGL